ncbi:outer membrane protein assembly factor BamE [Aurantiacibacter spongiae]|uniref:Outer membrane protein assembly factor BamE n=1 Tax=Aurantiacibacter spongiae TaxID=2488860 RepID=A0A3N5CUA2_9SPHN|nr:outer membrane protein assembly factor BamE [Aurantiacibacter spongiae]RPF71000.1 outer membrane protein assembly factor BamE [Aurantiacibacter spongiae]
MGATKRIMALGAVGLGLAAAGCSSIPDHKGYIVDETLFQAVQPGIDNRESVRGTLGTPTMTSEFGDPVWYYVSSLTRQAPFRMPRIAEHTVLAVTFDAAGNVVSAERSGIDQVVRLDPEDDETPTLGRERGFLEDLFGNIGTVGTGPGAGGAGRGPGG